MLLSPYVEGQETGDILSESQIRRRMEIIMPYTNASARSLVPKGNELIPGIAYDKGLRTMVGVVS
ncbi:MAG: hypothetical protein R2788_09475 [Saprospiraceae bacterium]